MDNNEIEPQENEQGTTLPSPAPLWYRILLSVTIILSLVTLGFAVPAISVDWFRATSVVLPQPVVAAVEPLQVQSPSYQARQAAPYRRFSSAVEVPCPVKWHPCDARVQVGDILTIRQFKFPNIDDDSPGAESTKVVQAEVSEVTNSTITLANDYEHEDISYWIRRANETKRALTYEIFKKEPPATDEIKPYAGTIQTKLAIQIKPTERVNSFTPGSWVEIFRFSYGKTKQTPVRVVLVPRARIMAVRKEGDSNSPEHTRLNLELEMLPTDRSRLDKAKKAKNDLNVGPVDFSLMVLAIAMEAGAPLAIAPSLHFRYSTFLNAGLSLPPGISPYQLSYPSDIRSQYFSRTLEAGTPITEDLFTKDPPTFTPTLRAGFYRQEVPCPAIDPGCVGIFAPGAQLRVRYSTEADHWTVDGVRILAVRNQILRSRNNRVLQGRSQTVMELEVPEGYRQNFDSMTVNGKLTVLVKSMAPFPKGLTKSARASLLKLRDGTSWKPNTCSTDVAADVGPKDNRACFGIDYSVDIPASQFERSYAVE